MAKTREQASICTERIREHGIGAGGDVTAVDRGDLIRVAQAPERRIVALEFEPGRDKPRTHGRIQHQGHLFNSVEYRATESRVVCGGSLVGPC
jgi:hypothetical protein